MGLGAGLGFAGATCAITLPLLFLLLVTDAPGGFFVYSSTLVQTTSILVLAGALLLLFSLILYRWSFSALRKVDPRFTVASVLCILGSIGFLCLLIAAAVVVGNAGSLLSCAHGKPSHALTCLESGQPFGAATGLIGFLLGWVGGLGIVVGLLIAGNRFGTGTFSGSGALYGILLLILIVPFVDLFVTVPDVSYLVVIAPLLSILAPALALAGSLRTSRRMPAA